MCGCEAQDTTGMVAVGVLPCGHTQWEYPAPPADSRKPWAVLYLNAQHRVMVGHTDYFWTHWGARRRARTMVSAMGPLAMWTAKVVRND